MTPPLWQKWRETKEPIDESERGEWKSWRNTQHSKNKDHGIWSDHFIANRWGNNGNSETLFSWAPKSLQMVTAAMKLKDAYSLEGKKKQRHYLANKDPSSQGYGFSSSHVWMWELDYKESWAPKNFLNCGAGENCWESLGLQGDPTSLFWRSVLGVHWKDWCWSWNSNTLATWCEELTH